MNRVDVDDRQPDDCPGQLGGLRKKAYALGDSPGVYIFKDSKGDVLYVGKAASLKQRVRSYFAPPSTLSPKIRAMMKKAQDIEFLVTDTELEALTLESNLIKTKNPRYNVLLRDDKHYPYLRVSTNDAWPKVGISRSVEEDGARYFGPYYPSGAVNEVLRLIRHLFPMRTCSDRMLKSAPRPCLNYHIGRCLAPCRGLVSEEEYYSEVANLCMFLEGRQKEVIDSLRKEMESSSESLDFERAAKIRDQIRAIEQMSEEQKAISTITRDMDVIGLKKLSGKGCVIALLIREGRLIGKRHYFTEEVTQGAFDEYMEDQEIVRAFLARYYREAESVPGEILIPVDLQDDDARLLPEYLSQKKGRKVRIKRPLRGEKRRLVDMAIKNAEAILKAAEAEEQALSDLANSGNETARVHELARVLSLKEYPKRLECFDISNIQGRDAVGSMVVFLDGHPQKSDYRRFRIKNTKMPNDFLMMKEVLTRRLSKIEDPESSWGKPDLIIVDGGKPQLSAALCAISETRVEPIPLIALAEEQELIFVPGRDAPIDLPGDSPALLLLRYIRDEAHRFAVSYHRSVRSKTSKWSVLDEIEGIGPKRKKMLIRKFGSIRGIEEASTEEITSIPGIGRRLAVRLREQIKNSAR
jgi:excinuclease ABC subunit C